MGDASERNSANAAAVVSSVASDVLDFLNWLEDDGGSWSSVTSFSSSRARFVESLGQVDDDDVGDEEAAVVVVIAWACAALLSSFLALLAAFSSSAFLADFSSSALLAAFLSNFAALLAAFSSSALFALLSTFRALFSSFDSLVVFVVAGLFFDSCFPLMVGLLAPTPGEPVHGLPIETSFAGVALSLSEGGADVDSSEVGRSTARPLPLSFFCCLPGEGDEY